MSSTRERIMEESLTLFSEKGYDGVSMRDIAAATGIKAASIYNHFKGKEAIFEAILEEMKTRYDVEAHGLNLDGYEPDKDADIYDNISQDTLVYMGKSLFLYFVQDTYAVKVRKMLTNGQFISEKLAAIYTRQYFDDPIAYQSQLFRLLMQKGDFIDTDPEIMAVHFFAPIHMLMGLHDRSPEREDEILKMLERHIRQFCRLYVKM